MLFEAVELASMISPGLYLDDTSKADGHPVAYVHKMNKISFSAGARMAIA
jgi:hypothetical protein